MAFSTILRGGRVVDPANGRFGTFDVGVDGDRVAEIAPELDPARAGRILEVGDCWVVPGVIDLHVHTSRRHGGYNAHRMMARAGVCTALDMGGPWDEFIEFAGDEGAGLNVASLQQVRPGLTVGDDDPGRGELEALLEKSLEEGAVGLKLLGGHYPMTPDSTRRAIEVANAARAYVAFHGGSTETGSNIEGFVESVELARDLNLHIPHVNSYCRGQIKERAIDEITEALDLLAQNRNIISESYLATINGTSGRCVDGVPESKATAQCLQLAGYPATEEGLEAAIRDGWARINAPRGGENVNITGEEAVRSWRARDTITSVNFPVNPAESRLLAATARNGDGSFVVDAIASDGGAHPRNVNVSSGMALVRTEALTAGEFVLKTSLNPARMLGCPSKGHLGEGADADITGIDPETGSPVFSLVGGELVLWRGALVGSGSTILTTERGVDALQAKGFSTRVVDVAGSMLYSGRPADPFSRPA